MGAYAFLRARNTSKKEGCRIKKAGDGMDGKNRQVLFRRREPLSLIASVIVGHLPLYVVAHDEIKQRS